MSNIYLEDTYTQRRWSKMNIYGKYIKNPENAETISKRWQNALELCKSQMTTEELMCHSSIKTAYPIARERYIKNNIPREEWDKFLIDSNPLFIN